ncbi:hypothetical protein [Aquiflexum sp.]|uniref:hypothetical protein n=1 Tax=Aquiflexum sp. TaxID=1872584 RepID=UPI0035933261
MGYIPLIIILGAVVALFFMVVNNTLNAKKNAILQFQHSIFEGMAKLGNPINTKPEIDLKTFGLIEEEYRKTKANLRDEHNRIFEIEVKLPLQSLKLTKSHYNKLVVKKPYSFVASLMGHKTI